MASENGAMILFQNSPTDDDDHDDDRRLAGLWQVAGGSDSKKEGGLGSLSSARKVQKRGAIGHSPSPQTGQPASHTIYIGRSVLPARLGLFSRGARPTG